VHLQRQDWQVPYLSEAGLLGLVPRQLALVRQVVLFCRGDAWVFARSILPAATLTGRQRCLDRLGERPLGAVLFTEPGACRGPVEFARLLPGGKLFTEATRVLADQPACLWGRRTLFYLQGKPLLVNEFFLPPIAACGPDARANLALAGA
jgi:chorismate--pyruvate lyase